MRYNLLKNNKIINTIIADAAFVSDYCAANGYTYQEAPLPESPEPEPTETEVLQAQVAALQAELLRIRTGG